MKWHCIVTSVGSSYTYSVFLWNWLKVFLLLSTLSLGLLPLLLNFALLQMEGVALLKESIKN